MSNTTRRLDRNGVRAAMVAAALGGCGGGSDGAKMTQAWEPDDSSGAGDESPAESSGAAATTDAPQPCDDVCESPPSDCQLAPGTCEGGTCSYPFALAGTPCTSGCTSAGYCDAAGTCICADACDDTCLPGPNMTAACNEAGECVRTCEAPFDDCDGDPSNGCEVPVGVPHQCDAAGLNPDGGCWTAYCGEAQGDGVFSFGTYHCVDCSTCAEPGGGNCHWCNHETGNWYPTEACACGGEFLNAVCGPA